MVRNPYSPANTTLLTDSAITDSVRPDSSSKRRDIGFALSMLGYGLIVTFAIIYFIRPVPGQDATLDGTEQLAEGIFHGFVGIILILAGLSASLVLGGVAAWMGSNAGKALLTFGAVFAILSICHATVSYYRIGG